MIDVNDDLIHEKLTDALNPGYQAEFDPDEAERAGAFFEDALTEKEAADSSLDLAGYDTSNERGEG